MIKNLDQILNEVPELNSDREYYFVRTNSGIYYEAFRKNDFIALGWNEITVEQIKDSLKDEGIKLKDKLISVYNSREENRIKDTTEEINYKNIIDPKSTKGKSKVTTILNKLQKFYLLKKGDIIVIPSKGSYRFSIGVVEDDAIYIENENQHECDYRKRRKVKWLAEKRFFDLDDKFYRLKSNLHSFSSLSHERKKHDPVDLTEYIDKIIYTSYTKGDFGYFTYRVGKSDDINAKVLFELGNDLVSLLEEINIAFNYNEDVSGVIIKINVQSQGDLLFKGSAKKSIITLYACLNLILSGCNPGENGIPSSLNKNTFERIIINSKNVETKNNSDHNLNSIANDIIKIDEEDKKRRD